MNITSGILIFGMTALCVSACTSPSVDFDAGTESYPIEFATMESYSRSDPSVASDSILDFDVFGSYVKDGVVGSFAEQNLDRLHVSRVSNTATQWRCTPLRYWISGTTYYFAATYPSGLKIAQRLVRGKESGDASYTAMLTVKDVEIDGKTDIVVAIPEPIVAAGTMDTVKLNFVHLMSKVSITFVNGFGALDDMNITIGDVTLYGCSSKADSVTLAKNVGEDWSVTWHENESAGESLLTLAGASSVAFGPGESISTNPVIVMPCSDPRCYYLKFAVHTSFLGLFGNSYEMLAEIDDMALESGESYNFTATLNGSNLVSDGSGKRCKLVRKQ